MSEHAQLVLAIGFAGLMAFAALALFCWVVWSLAWDLYDYLMQQRTRIRNNRFDGARRANQFHLPACFRDVKGIHR